MNDTNLSLDDMILKEGKPLNEQEEKLVTLEKANTGFAYDDGNIAIPGEKITLPISSDVEMEKKKANEHLAKQLAFDKLDKEKQAFKKMSDAEKIKDYIFQAEYYRNTNAFFEKYHYEMSGTQKRALKRNIERAWKNGKFKLTEEQKQDILYEVNKASNQINNNQKQSQPADPMAELTTLNSLITKG